MPDITINKIFFPIATSIAYTNHCYYEKNITYP